MSALTCAEMFALGFIVGVLVALLAVVYMLGGIAP